MQVRQSPEHTAAPSRRSQTPDFSIPSRTRLEHSLPAEQVQLTPTSALPHDLPSHSWSPWSPWSQEDGYLLGHDGDLNKADEEEDKRGTRHVGTKSVIHLLGVLRGQGRVRGRRHRPCLLQPRSIPDTPGAAHSQDGENPQTSAGLSS